MRTAPAAFSPSALQLIVRFEGLNQPGRWPGYKSGITLGYGYDLGYVTVDQFESDWEGCFADAEVDRLGAAVGRRAAEAQRLAPRLSDIRCTSVDSQRVLLTRTIPAYVDLGRRTFPGFDRLPLDAQGALVSLVYNRGGSMIDTPGTDNRREMRAIRDLVPRLDLPAIAEQLESMKRLWDGKGLDGLLRRREAEAALVRSCVAPTGVGKRKARVKTRGHRGRRR